MTHTWQICDSSGSSKEEASSVCHALSLPRKMQMAHGALIFRLIPFLPYYELQKPPFFSADVFTQGWEVCHHCMCNIAHNLVVGSELLIGSTQPTSSVSPIDVQEASQPLDVLGTTVSPFQSFLSIVPLCTL